MPLAALHAYFWFDGRNQGTWKKKNMCTGRAYNLHTDSPRGEPASLLLWGVSSTVQPCCPFEIKKVHINGIYLKIVHSYSSFHWRWVWIPIVSQLGLNLEKRKKIIICQAWTLMHHFLLSQRDGANVHPLCGGHMGIHIVCCWMSILLLKVWVLSVESRLSASFLCDLWNRGQYWSSQA